MKRKGFLKSLAILFAAPKIIGKIGVSTSKVSQVKSVDKLAINKSMVSELELLRPAYYKEFEEKYGNCNFYQYIETII